MVRLSSPIQYNSTRTFSITPNPVHLFHLYLKEKFGTSTRKCTSIGWQNRSSWNSIPSIWTLKPPLPVCKIRALGQRLEPKTLIPSSPSGHPRTLLQPPRIKWVPWLARKVLRWSDPLKYFGWKAQLQTPSCWNKVLQCYLPMVRWVHARSTVSKLDPL